MQRSLFAVLAVAAALAILVSTSWLRRAHEVIPWQTDFQAARLESQKTGKPILLDFSADWCGPCQEMRRTTWSDTHVAEALRNYVPVQVNVDNNSQLAGQFEVRGIPHLVVLNPKGDIAKTSEGAMGPEEFLKWLGTKPAPANDESRLLPPLPPGEASGIGDCPRAGWGEGRSSSSFD